MVPCQPRQLVILSLPFAALVAFFWFKRRKSLSRSDPGGTPARQKPGDTAINGKLTEEVIKKKIIETVEAKKPFLEVNKASVDVKKACVEEEVVAKPVVIVECSPKSLEEETAELVKSLEIACADIKEIVCNISAAEIKEENPLVSDLGNNQIFHSTVIETDKDFEDKKDNTVNLLEDSFEKGDDNNSVKETDTLETPEQHCDSSKNQEELKEFKQSQFIPFEEQSTLEYIPSGKKIIEEDCKDRSEETVIDNICASSGTDTENTSIDTGLGSQDPSGVEEITMAQGQKTDEKSENNATGLEQKLATLGLDTTQQPVQRNERDSANHSPAEVMLNSPAISTFSDAHSEGSSDSGKGCSDVLTPPSRTPAGGSSVAGDLAPSVYEFVLPQVIVGRLIGRHGAFLHDIRAKTHTHVFIKKHPETSSLKICAIEGTQQDIDAALKMIRQKFPLRRFPDLTLEKVSFVKNPCMPLNFESLQLNLVEGVNNDVILSSLITAGNFFLQMPSHISYQSLYKLACIMNTVYNTQDSPVLVEPQPNMVCAAPTHGGWYRAQVMSVDEESNSSEVKFLDYGGYMTVDNSCLRQIRGDFLLLPFQAVECFLANVVPAGGEECWSEEARQFVQLMTTNQTLQAQVYDYTEAGLPLVYLYCTQFYQSLTDPSGYETKVVLLNEELVSHGFAELIQEDQTVAVPESS